MKTLQFRNSDDSIIVNYLTDLIGEAKSLTVYQIKTLFGIVGGQNVEDYIGLADNAIQLGLPDKLEGSSLEEMTALAQSLSLSLEVLETGEVSQVISSPFNDFLAFSFPQETGEATIDTGAHTVAIEVATGTPVTALVATFKVGAGAIVDIADTVQESGVTANDFTAPVVYTITSANGDEQDWTVTVTVAV
jgi:hypothetical protein